MDQKKNIKTYSELISLPTFKERFDYVNLHGRIGEETFGYDRFYNQRFYTSKEWRDFRNFIIARDLGCDLGLKDRPISGRIIVHHLNPIDITDIQDASEFLLNPEYVICVSSTTHDAIHYGDFSKVNDELTERKPDDTKLWR